jgi:hypothetical protein
VRSAATCFETKFAIDSSKIGRAVNGTGSIWCFSASATNSGVMSEKGDHYEITDGLPQYQRVP